MRLDKFLGVTGCCSRSDAKRAIRGKNVTVNGCVVKSADIKIDPIRDDIFYFGKQVVYREHSYIMLNKPDGVVSATDDIHDRTVLDLLPPDVRNDRMFPCGRLDKNTLGLMLITDDGELAHELLSPKNHVSKMYRFSAQKEIEKEDAKRFENGVTLDDGYVTLPAKIELDEDRKGGYITLTEGKYHQIKRMLGALDNGITYLERITFGPLMLDTKLERGHWRYLTDEEISALKDHKTNKIDKGGQTNGHN